MIYIRINPTCSGVTAAQLTPWHVVCMNDCCTVTFSHIRVPNCAAEQTRRQSEFLIFSKEDLGWICKILPQTLYRLLWRKKGSSFPRILYKLLWVLYFVKISEMKLLSYVNRLLSIVLQFIVKELNSV